MARLVLKTTLFVPESSSNFLALRIVPAAGSALCCSDRAGEEAEGFGFVRFCGLTLSSRRSSLSSCSRDRSSLCLLPFPLLPKSSSLKFLGGFFGRAIGVGEGGKLADCLSGESRLPKGSPSPHQNAVAGGGCSCGTSSFLVPKKHI